MITTGNAGLDALADAIAERVYERLHHKQQGEEKRLFSVAEAAKYIGRSPVSVRHMIADRTLPSVRRDNRVFLDRGDLDRWIEMGKV
ncbi:MAG: helix-turn-helix domain-containing protein [Acidobacteriales bacterium]|nr:helix-turn-helix domain-containing protein [Terriglobales bacterium]